MRQRAKAQIRSCKVTPVCRMEAKAKGKQAFIYISNRLEGNALETIAAMSEELGD